MKRRFTLYLGPTNSGKTHQALKRLFKAKHGIYLAPLRLLALEVSETLRDLGVPCNMITGEERIFDRDAQHTASTIEMLNLHTHYDLCVIDESQMLGDASRGWAWTQAILGVRAEEVCIIGAPECLTAVLKLLTLTEESYEIIYLERMTPLLFLDDPVTSFDSLKPRTALIAFSRANVLALRSALKKETGEHAAVIYGALPPEVRRRQASLFASGKTPFLIATDAIGMGLNLPIQTLLFSQDKKSIHRKKYPLTPMEVRQIGGRAGRFGKNEQGFVGTFRCPIHHVQRMFQTPPSSITHVHLAPNLDHLHAIHHLTRDHADPELAKLLTLFLQTVKPDPKVYKHADLADQTTLAKITDRYKTIPLATRFLLSGAPVSLRSNQIITLFERMVHAVAHKQKMSLDALFLKKPPEENLARLTSLETAVHIINLYCWLHYRFPDIFPSLKAAEKRRNRYNQDIDALLKQDVSLEKRYSNTRVSMDFRMGVFSL